MPGVFKHVQDKTDPKLCFVMMPFDESFNALYRLMERCCKEQGLRCERADTDVSPGKITSKIYSCIRQASIVLADMTGRNPNVFYELGLAHAISDNVILLAQSIDDIPFDLKDFLHIRYTNTFDGAEKLANDLSKVLARLARSADVVTEQTEQEAVESLAVAGETAGEIDTPEMLHIRAEIAKEMGHLAEAKQFLLRALELARSGEGDADDVTNCAIEAESCKFRQIAQELYEIALARDPRHIQAKQCYVSFLLDEYPNDPERVTIAGQMLDALESVTEKQERTKALRAQFCTKPYVLAHQPEGAHDEVLEKIMSETDFHSLREALPALNALQKLKRIDEVTSLLKKIRECVPEEEKKDCDRALADALASSDDEENREKAMGIYAQILSDSNEDPDVQHNLATLLFGRGGKEDREKACALWQRSYEAMPYDLHVRRAFSRCLLSMGKKEIAQRVLEGKQLEA